VRVAITLKSTGKIKVAPPAAAGGAAAAAAGDAADSSLPDSTPASRWVLFGMGLVAVLIALLASWIHWHQKPFAPSLVAKANFGLFAGFYIGAQVIERLGEFVSPLLPPWDFPNATGAAAAAHVKADRATLMLGVTFIAGVLLSLATGLYFLAAVGFAVSHTVDVIVSGLVLSGGTTGLHNLISLAQKSGNPPTTKSTGD
jgi:hypothetical protein